MEILVFGDDSTPLKVYGRFREVPGNKDANKKTAASTNTKKPTKSPKSEKQRASKILHESDCPVYKEGQVLDSGEFQRLAEFYDYSATRVAQNNEYWTMFRFNPNHWKYVTKLPKTRAAIVNTEYCFEIIVARMDKEDGGSKKLKSSPPDSHCTHYRVTIMHVVRSTSFRIANTRSLLRTKSKEDSLVYNQYDRGLKTTEGNFRHGLPMNVGASSYGISLPPQLSSLALQTMYPPSQGAAQSLAYSIDLRTPRGYVPPVNARVPALPTPYGTAAYSGQDGKKRAFADSTPIGSTLGPEGRRLKQRLMPLEPQLPLTPSAMSSPQFHPYSSHIAKGDGLKQLPSSQVDYPASFGLMNQNALLVSPSSVGLSSDSTNLYLETQAMSARAACMSKPFGSQGRHETPQSLLGQNLNMSLGNIYGNSDKQTPAPQLPADYANRSPSKDSVSLPKST